MVTSKTKRLIQDSWHRYRLAWGNFKSDRHKSKRTLRAEISDLLGYGHFTKKDYIKIKDMIYDIAKKNAGFE